MSVNSNNINNNNKHINKNKNDIKNNNNTIENNDFPIEKERVNLKTPFNPEDITKISPIINFIEIFSKDIKVNIEMG
jgi:hypothetical protein